MGLWKTAAFQNSWTPAYSIRENNAIRLAIDALDGTTLTAEYKACAVRIIKAYSWSHFSCAVRSVRLICMAVKIKLG